MAAVVAQHLMPADDIVEHAANHHCLCGVTWRAVWSDDLGSVVWIFIHHAADGRR